MSRGDVVGATSGAAVGALIGGMIAVSVSDNASVVAFISLGAGVGGVLGVFYWKRPFALLTDLFASIW